MHVLRKQDIQNYFSKFGKIVDFDFQSSNNRALIAFASSGEAEFACFVAKLDLKGHKIVVKPVLTKR